ncbi:putative ABC transporter permease [uncultured Enorma sp.]|uniref:putative ABC transporter permease n=1 Tax=uncultured Enorma sp. TaxID=1714346 RepID=UPI0026187065|nr:putative ABC transporter permease [uncultured Enorma sp.]
MEDLTKSQETELEDFDLPGNDLDPNTPTPAEQKKIPLVVKVYGFLCLIDGIVTIPTIAMFIGLVAWALNTDPSLITVGTNPTLPVVLLIISLVVTTANAVALIIFGRSLLHNRRRHAARISHVLIATTIVQVLLKLMLSGLDTSIITDAVQLVIVITLSITVDPTLREERKLQRNLRDMVDRQAAEVGMLGRDIEGKGFIELNFFNLFWVFVVCCFLGLIIETIYHMVVVEPGVYQDRAGLLFGPFSPIYGFGALLMTVALNRFYKANPIIIFVVSAIIGGLFEAATAWFMQVGFGATAWDYSGSTIFGLFPDPIAVIFGGRTSTLFMCMWGALGFVWIKLCLPRLLKLINLIPWKLRYSLTTLCALLMLVNGIMTLQALDCWYERLSGTAGDTPVEEFYARNFDNDYMQHRFQSMEITPEDSGRVDTAA